MRAAEYRSSGETGPQVSRADSDDQEADKAADQGIGQPGLDAGAGVSTSQPAEP
jgi:hypothetical protein